MWGIEYGERMPALYICAILAWGIALARYDFAEHRLPDRLTLPAYPAAVGVVADLWPELVGPALVTGGVALVIGFAASRLADLGLGDVKLLGVWGIVAGGSGEILGSLALVAILGGLHALIHLAITRDRAAHIPFGPAILAGFIPVVLDLG